MRVVSGWYLGFCVLSAFVLFQALHLPHSIFALLFLVVSHLILLIVCFGDPFLFLVSLLLPRRIPFVDGIDSISFCTICLYNRTRSPFISLLSTVPGSYRWKIRVL